jgi:hypothetical protein
MNRIAIDRLDLSLGGMDSASAEAVRAELPRALRRTLARRLAHAGASGRVLDLAGADLGTLELPMRTSPRVAADAIAARLADWLDVRLAAGSAAPEA